MKSYEYRELAGKTTAVKVLLGGAAALSVVSLASSYLQIDLLRREHFSQAQADANDTRQILVGLVTLVWHITTVVVFSVWIVRANKNVRALGAQGLRVTPGWAVGYFFIPIVNLWKPYQAMKDLWQASHVPESWARVPVAATLPIWWGFWITSGALNRISFQLSMEAETADAILDVTYLDTVVGVIDIGLCLLAMSVVSRIGRAQPIAARDSVF